MDKEYIEEYGRRLDERLAHSACARIGLDLSSLLLSDLFHTLIQIYGFEDGVKEFDRIKQHEMKVQNERLERNIR